MEKTWSAQIIVEVTSFLENKEISEAKEQKQAIWRKSRKTVKISEGFWLRYLYRSVKKKSPSYTFLQIILSKHNGSFEKLQLENFLGILSSSHQLIHEILVTIIWKVTNCSF